MSPTERLGGGNVSTLPWRFTNSGSRGRDSGCGKCARCPQMTSDGKIRTCLFSQSDHDLYGEMARGGTDDELDAYIRRVVMQKEARHHIGEPGFQKPSRNMVHIGG